MNAIEWLGIYAGCRRRERRTMLDSLTPSDMAAVLQQIAHDGDDPADYPGIVEWLNREATALRCDMSVSRVILTNEECVAIHDLIDMLSGGNANNVFSNDGKDDWNNPTTRACFKIYHCIGRDVPFNLLIDPAYCPDKE